jgi:serine/threonine-protein kinase
VWSAEHVGLERPVALKLLDRALGDPDGERRFEREARAAARLDHAGCVRVLDHGRAVDGQLYLAMDLLEGPTLAQWLRAAGALPVAAALELARELLGALGYAHGHGVLHRDVKPENVMLARRGRSTRVVLIDFGLARLRDEAGITRQGTCVGSPSYVAPERLLGDDGDERADLYAVGLVLWECLAGRRPFGDGAPLEIAARQVQDPVPPLGASRPDVPRALEIAIARALVKDPKGRFASAGEMLAALDAACRPVPAGTTAYLPAAAAVSPPPPPARAAVADVPTARLPRQRTIERAATVPALAPPPVPRPPTVADDEAACAETLAFRLGPGPLHRRVVAWWRHGAWRWREA